MQTQQRANNDDHHSDPANPLGGSFDPKRQDESFGSLTSVAFPQASLTIFERSSHRLTKFVRLPRRANDNEN
jgi:hypothetical protein